MAKDYRFFFSILLIAIKVNKVHSVLLCVYFVVLPSVFTVSVVPILLALVCVAWAEYIINVRCATIWKAVSAVFVSVHIYSAEAAENIFLVQVVGKIHKLRVYSCVFLQDLHPSHVITMAILQWLYSTLYTECSEGIAIMLWCFACVYLKYAC